MPEFLRQTILEGPAIAPWEVLVRLLMALVLGWVVAWVYRNTRRAGDYATTFPSTLVLLAILIAMVTQVIGDNVARAFSLVGALSIVRFRTVVRDTQDTAFVIFSVAVGMAVGASDTGVALIGILVVGVAAFLMRASRGDVTLAEEARFRLEVRIGKGHDLNGPLAAALDEYVSEKGLISVGTARQGLSLTALYLVRLRPGRSAEDLVKTLNRVDGVQSVEIKTHKLADITL